MKDSQLGRDVIDVKIDVFFKAVIDVDIAIIQLIRDTPGDISYRQGELVFDLPTLYQLIVPLGETSYRHFKKILYSGTLNKTLALKGMNVIVWRIAKHVDLTRYCLCKKSSRLASDNVIQ